MEIPEGWKRTALFEVLECLESGSRPPGGIKKIKEGVPSIGGEHLNRNGGFDFENIRLIPKAFYHSMKRGKTRMNDVLVVKDGATTGKTSFIGEDFPYQEAAVNEHVFILRGKKEDINQKFLFFHLSSKKGQRQINASFHGAAIGGINSQFAKSYELLLPPLDKQRKIVRVLEKAEQIKQWRRDADKLTVDYINSTFLKMFGHRLPKNNIGDIAEFVSSGCTPLGGESTYLPEGIVFIRSQNVHMNELRLDNVAHISEDVHKQMKRTWVKNGDVLINITGASLGRVAVYEGESDKANVNQHVCIIRVNTKKAIPQFIAHYLSMPNPQKEIWTVQAGASRQALNFKQVKGLKIYLPYIERQREFVDIVTCVNKLRKWQGKSLEEIEMLFESLVFRAMKGDKIC